MMLYRNNLQFPDPLGRVELRAVGRQKVQSELVATFVAPRLVQFGMVVLCIVCDHNSAPIRGATYLVEIDKELLTGLGVERALFSPPDEVAIALVLHQVRAEC